MKIHLLIFTAALACLPLAGGCKSMTPGQLSRIQPDSDAPYAGNVYLLRGFIGIWSYGVDHIGEKINSAGVRASVFQEDQWQSVTDTIIQKYATAPAHEPLVLIGHSYGADDVIRMAKRLGESNIPVDLVITLDPVVPPKVPSCIKLCYNIYQPSLLDSLPFFRGIALETEAPGAKNLQNVNIRAERRDLLESDTDHFNIEKNEKIHAEIVKKVLEVCPQRSRWVAQMRTHDSAGAVKVSGSGQNRGDISAAGRIEPARLGAGDAPGGQGQ